MNEVTRKILVKEVVATVEKLPPNVLFGLYVNLNRMIRRWALITYEEAMALLPGGDNQADKAA